MSFIEGQVASATSEPKGPVYLWARREVMEEEVDPGSLDNISGLSKWPSIEPTALSPSGELSMGVNWEAANLERQP